MKNVFAILTLSSLLVACASSRPPAAPESRTADTTPALQQDKESQDKASSAQAADQAAVPEHQDEALPAVALTPELLEKLLGAELAQQRGQWQSAYVAFLSAAQQTRDPRLAHRAADIALQANQEEEALAAVRLWHELAPNSEESDQYLASLDILSDDMSGVKPILAKRLQAASPQERGPLMFQMQRLLMRAKNKALAFSTLEQLLAPYKDNADSHIALAHAAFANNDAARARSETEAALAIQPDSELAILTMAEITPDKQTALSTLAAFLDAHPHAKDVRRYYARLLIEQKEFRKASKEYDTLLVEDPDNVTSVYAAGILAAQLHDYDAAEKHLKKYLALLAKNPDDTRDPAPALLTLAQIAEERKDTSAALKWLAKVEPGDSYASAQFRRAQILAKRGDLAAARAVLNELKPEGAREQAQVVMAEAQLLRDAGRSAEALRTLEAGLKRFPDDTDLLYDYAMAAEKVNKLDEMETALKHLIKLAPDNQNAYNALGYTFADRNIRLQEAQTLIEKALKLSPDDPFIMDSMGWVEYRLGHLKEAENYLQRAYDSRPDPDIGAHLGEVLWAQGKKDAAKKIWREAHRKDAENDTLKSTLKRLHIKL